MARRRSRRRAACPIIPLSIIIPRETCGNISNDYSKLIKLVARVQHPGVGIDGKYDVDGLRSQAVAFARRTVAAGVWRANYMTISAWASRTYGAVAVV